MSARKITSNTEWRWTGCVKRKFCERCNTKKQLVVHHRDRDPSNNADHFNLETLCRACHASEHSAEIAERQRDPEVNTRRGKSISETKQARKGTKYPLMSKSLKKNWKGAVGVRLREKHATPETRKRHSDVMRKLMNDPAHIERRRQLKEARRENS